MPQFSSDERQLLHDSVQDFFANQYSFEQFRELSATSHESGFSQDAWRQYGELGWLGVAAPETAGGTGAGLTELAIIMAGAGSALAMEPLLSSTVLAGGALELVASPDQAHHLDTVISGEKVWAFCHAEPDGGYAREYVGCVATATADGYVINGQKTFALHAQAADQLIVTARLGDANGPVSLFVVSSDSPGLRLHAAPSLDERRGAALVLDSVSVGADAILGQTGQDQTEAVNAVLDRGVLAVCAEACGAMAAVTEQTVEYLKVRKQFGQPLAKFQVLQHRLVDMNISCEEARAATHAALTAADNGEPDARTKIWRAKVQVGRSARYVGSQAVQLHGGMGMTDELVIGHYYKRLSMCESLFGDADWYLRQLANQPD